MNERKVGTRPEIAAPYGDLTFRVVSNVNITRSNVWHAADEWSLLEWAGAMCGEAGETANVAKKLRRIEQGLVGAPGDREVVIRTKLAQEIGDTYLYLDLLATKAGLRIEDCVRMAFNGKSEELGFPHRIP